ncbi:MAG: RNA polymerase sigma factor [Clostridia bacterium]|nr:RNA polymerase sigma factor [Clostridia bacterium]
MLIFYMTLADSSGDQSMVEQIYHQYKKLIKYIALSRLCNEHLAEEAVHEVMLAVILHVKRLKGRTEGELRGFLYLVTRNVCNDILRKETRQQAEDLETLWETPQGGADPQEQLGAQIILEQITAMPAIYRDPLELTACYGFTAKEAAAILHISPAACRKRLERAREMLREKLEKGEADHEG